MSATRSGRPDPDTGGWIPGSTQFDHRYQGDHPCPIRDTVVVKEGGSSAGLILGFIAILLVLAGAWYFLMGPGAGTTTDGNNDINVNIELPSVAPAAS